MKTWQFLLLLPLLLFFACAHVPRETVELSATIGRDIAVTHKAHIQLATLLFDKMKSDVNRFVDSTYAPYQIKNVMDSEMKVAESTDPNVRNTSLLLGINAAFKPDASNDLRAAVLNQMGYMVNRIRLDVEKMRENLLNPINEQEKNVLGSINHAYQQMLYANSVVTGNIASVVEVHEAQAELLAEFGIKKDLRKEVGEGIADVSGKIASIVETATHVDNKLEDAESTAKSIKDAIKELEKLYPKKKEK